MTLPPQITIRNIQPVPEDLEPAIVKEIAVLERFFKRIMSCRVMVEKMGKRRFGAQHHVRIELGVPNEELVVERVPTLYKNLRDAEAAKKTKQSEIKGSSREVHRAIHEAFHEMRRRLQDYSRRMQGRAKQPQLAAKVARLFDDYGFLETTDGREIYFHRNSVLDGRFAVLRVGSKVRFTEESGEKGPQASTVCLTHPSRQTRKIEQSGEVQAPARQQTV